MAPADTDAGQPLRVTVLGPVRAWLNGHQTALGGPRPRAILAVLALHANRPVSRTEIIDAVWGDEPPASAANNVHVYINRLRRALEPDRASRAADGRLASAGSGYLLRLASGHLDADLFRDHLRRAAELTAAGQLDEAVDAYDAALALWQSTPLADLTGSWADTQRHVLTELHRAAVEDRADALLRLGRHGQVITDLTTHVADHPLRERPRGLLMTALYRAGRQADALALYTDTRALLVDELGVEPGPALQQIHHAILANTDPSPAQPARDRRAAEPAMPRQLPPAVRHFAGRSDQLQALTALLPETAGGTVVITAIDGTAGIGKTTLAVHWAHQVAERFPDGQLYVNLRGFMPAGTPMPATEAIRGFLAALGVRADHMPQDPTAQTGLYRSLLADKRMLVVLDNARDAEQVRPLLPGSARCLVIVTSRNQLTGLIAAEGAHPVTLGLLTAAEARDLLARYLGEAAVRAEPGAVDAIIARCGGLPLALTIVAGKARTRPDTPLAALADELRLAASRLDPFDVGDQATDLRAVFSWSYHTLSPPAARLFRLLGVHPGPDVSAAAAVSLAGVPPTRVRALLAELTRTHLVNEHAPRRYTLHDLLRAYARELADEVDTPNERREAVHRLLDHYLHTAHRAARLLHPGREPLTLASPRAGVQPEEPADHTQALSWYLAEYPVLLAAVTRAADEGFDTHAWQLPWTLVTFLYRRGHWDQWATTQQTALAAAGRLDDRIAQARVHVDLGYLGLIAGDHDDAENHLRRALHLYRHLGDVVGQARVHNAMAGIQERRGRLTEALVHAQQSLALYRTHGSPSAQANAQTELSWLHALLGHHRQAIDEANHALRAHRQLGNRHGEGNTLDTLGYAHHHLGKLDAAIEYYQQSLTVLREIANREGEANVLSKLGDTQHAAGDPRAADDAWRQALAIFEDLRHPGADEVRTKLRRR